MWQISFPNGPNSWSSHLFLGEQTRAPVVSPLMVCVCEAMSHCQAEGVVLTQTLILIQLSFFISYHSPRKYNLSHPVPNAVNTFDNVKAGRGNQSAYWSPARSQPLKHVNQKGKRSRVHLWERRSIILCLLSNTIRGGFVFVHLICIWSGPIAGVCYCELKEA